MSEHILLLTATPHRDENLPGYILRLSEKNGYQSPLWITEKIQDAAYKSFRSVLFGNVDWSRLSSLTGVPINTLINSAYLPITGSEVKNVFNSRPIPRYLLKDRPKICPECLKEDTYTRKAWDIAFYTSCPVHNKLLITHCPHCSLPLSWSRKSITQCRCGFDLSKAVANLADYQDTAVSKHISYLLSGTLPVSKSGIDGLELEDFLAILSFIGGQYLGINDTMGKTLSGLPMDRLHTILKKAYSVFIDWPKNFYAFLDQSKGVLFSNVFYKTGLKREFGNFYPVLYRHFNTPQFYFLRSAFEVYGHFLWKGGYISEKSRVTTRQRKGWRRYYGKAEASKFLGVIIEKIDDLIRIGYLKAYIQSMGKTNMYRIDIDSLKKFKNEYDNSLTLEQTAGILGVTRHRVTKLIKSQYLVPLLGPEIDGSPVWRIKRISIDSLFESIRSKLCCRIEFVNLIPFHDAVQKLSILKVDTTKLIKLIQAGAITPRKDIPGYGLNSFFFDEFDISLYIKNELEKQKGVYLTQIETAELLNIKQEVVNLWLKKKLIKNALPPNRNSKWWKISPIAIKNFVNTYVLAAPLAKSLGTSPGCFVNRCRSIDIFPVSGPTIDGGRQYIFRRADVDQLLSIPEQVWANASTLKKII